MWIFTGSINVNNLYDAFVNQFLPTISKGLVITQEYFIDFFGRFIMYRIALNIIPIVFLLIWSIIILLNIKKLHRRFEFKSQRYEEEYIPALIGIYIRLAVTIIILFVCWTAAIWRYIVPEWKVYQLFILNQS